MSRQKQCRFCGIKTQDPHHLLECEALEQHEVEEDKKLYIVLPMCESYVVKVDKNGNTLKIHDD